MIHNEVVDANDLFRRFCRSHQIAHRGPNHPHRHNPLLGLEEVEPLAPDHFKLPPASLSVIGGTIQDLQQAMWNLDSQDRDVMDQGAHDINIVIIDTFLSSNGLVIRLWVPVHTRRAHDAIIIVYGQFLPRFLGLGLSTTGLAIIRASRCWLSGS